jgi:hypothetical protein
MLRSVMTHGLLVCEILGRPVWPGIELMNCGCEQWTLIDRTKLWIDSEPFERYTEAAILT